MFPHYIEIFAAMKGNWKPLLVLKAGYNSQKITRNLVRSHI